ncbi:plasmid replication protein RepC [Sphingomonas sp. GM_Shp_2]|uniref:plasmid replication protein RepC n=1 Tax=Sphingomonas sp. GM_Shp_2 TaxID=2937380 RepID=UPI00226A91C1|nr:plasmid replication protein RepC [Sphingomonas sp. GM_Shp_2]
MTYTQSAFTGGTGARPITAFSRRIARELESKLADAPAEVERKAVFAVVKRAAPALGIGIGALQTLEHLISYTHADDWKAGRTPVAWPSNLTLAEVAGKTVSAIKARLRQLRALGLILARDSGHGRRTGRRDDSGAISTAFGVDLSPLRIRFEELRELAEAYSAQSRLFKEGRQEIARVRRIVSQALAQAAHLRLTGPHWLALQEAIDHVASAAAIARAGRDSEAFRSAIGRLAVVEERVGLTIDQFMFPEESEGSGSKNEPFIHIQTNPSPIKDVHAVRACSSDPAGQVSPTAELPASPSNSQFKARPADLLEMFPTTAMYVGGKKPAWSDIHRAASRLRHDLGIRIGVYVDALEKLGPDAAAIAIMITAERHSRSEIRLTPGAYFTGMVGKAKRDELDLAKSLWGFRTERMATH